MVVSGLEEDIAKYSSVKGNPDKVMKHLSARQMITRRIIGQQYVDSMASVSPIASVVTTARTTVKLGEGSGRFEDVVRSPEDIVCYALCATTKNPEESSSLLILGSDRDLVQKIHRAVACLVPTHSATDATKLVRKGELGHYVTPYFPV